MSLIEVKLSHLGMVFQRQIGHQTFLFMNQSWYCLIQSFRFSKLLGMGGQAYWGEIHKTTNQPDWVTIWYWPLLRLSFCFWCFGVVDKYLIFLSENLFLKELDLNSEPVLDLILSMLWILLSLVDILRSKTISYKCTLQ